MNKIRKIYCDFDGTITKHDTIHLFVKAFGQEGWKEAEALWREGKMTSRDCIKHQMGLLRDISERELEEFIDDIEIDPHFEKFYNYILEKGFDFTILSDGFDFFIQKTLEKHGLSGIKFYTNKLVRVNNRLDVEFPNHNPDCSFGSGSCKCEKIKEKSFYYIGDGRSDICVSKKASVLFAKKVLREYCEENNIRHTPYENFDDILEIFKEKFND